MKKLLGYMRAYLKETVLAPFFKLLEASFELAVPLVVARIIDVGIKSGNNGIIITDSIILLVLGVVGLASALTAQYFAAKAAIGFATDVRSRVFGHLQRVSYTSLDRLGKSRMVTTLTNDINQLQTGVNMVLRLLLRSPLIVFGSMIMAFTIDAGTATIFAVMIPLLFISVFAVMKITLPKYKDIQTELDSIVLSTRESFGGVRDIRAFGAEGKEEEAFRKKNAAYRKMQNSAGIVSSVLNPLTFVIVNFAIIALVWVGAVKVDGGSLSQGQVIALYGYLSQILIELMKLANLIVTITRSIAAGNRVEEVLEIPEENTDGKTLLHDGDIAVKFENVSLCYDGASENSLENVSFEVPKGYTVGVIGGTGSGKTSLVNLIPKFYTATSGKIEIGGRDISELSAKELRDTVGYVPQKSVLFRGTLRENLLWGNENATDEEIMKAVKIAQAENVIASKSDGLDSYVAQGGGNFSGGQKQRLCIARALVKNPDILILDDSCSALDYLTDKNLRHALSSADKKMTVFIVSQRTASFSDADMIIVLDDGKVSAIGTHEELLEKSDVYREIYESQYGDGEAGA